MIFLSCIFYVRFILVRSPHVKDQNSVAKQSSRFRFKMSSADEKGASAASSDPNSSSLLLNQPIVIDNGTATIKAGFAGGSKPKVRLLGW